MSSEHGAEEREIVSSDAVRVGDIGYVTWLYDRDDVASSTFESGLVLVTHARPSDGSYIRTTDVVVSEGFAGGYKIKNLVTSGSLPPDARFVRIAHLPLDAVLEMISDASGGDKQLIEYLRSNYQESNPDE